MLVAVVANYVCDKLVVQRVLVAVVAKYVCEKSVEQRVLVTFFRCYKMLTEAAINFIRGPV